MLAGVGASALCQWVEGWWFRQGRVVAVLLALAVLLPTLQALRGGLQLKAPELVALGRYVREKVPADQQLFAFEPAWGLVGGRLPPVIPGAPLVVDSYAMMLQRGMAAGQSLPHAEESFHVKASQQPICELLEQSEFVVLGWRGERQLSEKNKQWFRAHFTRRFPENGKEGPDLWERVSGTGAGADAGCDGGKGAPSR